MSSQTQTQSPNPKTPRPRRRTCSLIITHQCNLKCTYCYELFKSKMSMSFDLAKAILLNEFERLGASEEFDEIVIDFMGGEPMI